MTLFCFQMIKLFIYFPTFYNNKYYLFYLFEMLYLPTHTSMMAVWNDTKRG